MNLLPIKIGNFLYKNIFPVYNFLYPIFKNRQDKREISILRTYIKSNDKVLDIGANIGFYTQILSRLVGENGKVFCFEPDTLNYKRLQQNCGKLPNAMLYNKAVSDETGLIKIYKSTFLNVDHRTYPSDFYDVVEEIDCVCLDEFLGNQPIDFIKIDIQGFETAAFRGLKKTLVNNPNLKILSEFWPYGIHKAGESTEAFLSIFWAAGFHVYLIKESGFENINQANWQQYAEQSFSVYNNILVTRDSAVVE